MSYSKTISFPRTPKGFTVSSIAQAPVSISVAEEDRVKSYEQGKQEAAAFYQQEIKKLREEYSLRQETLLGLLQDKIDGVLNELSARLPTLVVNTTERVLGNI